jgi:hypothetical protein
MRKQLVNHVVSKCFQGRVITTGLNAAANEQMAQQRFA